jgi:hypothetical protein
MTRQRMHRHSGADPVCDLPQRVASEKSLVTGTGRAITSAAAQSGPPPEGERLAADDRVTDAGLSHLAALGDILGGRGVKCDLNDSGAWPRLRIYGPYDIDSAVAEFDNNVLVVPRGDDWWFAWPWSETIALVTDVVTAAGRIADELGWASQ